MICNMGMVDIIMMIIIMNIMAVRDREDIMMINTMTNSIMKKKIQKDSHRVVQVVRDEDVRRVHAVRVDERIRRENIIREDKVVMLQRAKRRRLNLPKYGHQKVVQQQLRKRRLQRRSIQIIISIRRRMMMRQKYKSIARKKEFMPEKPLWQIEENLILKTYRYCSF